MSKDDKKDFMKKVTILIDSREQVNDHITAALSQLGIMYETRKLDYGDYSFIVEGKDFSSACVIERKGKIDELYGNITTDRDRIEKELDVISKNAVQCTLLLEGCKDWDYLKAFEISAEGAEKQGRKVRNIGATVYGTLQAWRLANRFNFDVEFIWEREKSAIKILELFYWYYHNYKKQIAPRR